MHKKLIWDHVRYVAGAIPGKSLKRKTTESEDKREKTKKYEENRKAPKFNVKWLTNREWLDYDESNDIMRHDMQNMAMMMTFVKIGVMKLKTVCIYEYTRE